MRFYIIAGEASGDLHAANLIKEIRKIQPGSIFRGLGGDLMKEQGVSLLKHYRQTAFMGFVEVIKNLKKILGFISECKKDILEWKPDAIILVDYPGFNLRIAEFAKQNGYKVFYYISPQVWAWKASRVKKIKRDVDRMFVILPFEKDFYKTWNYEVDFVGHPLLDAVKDFVPEKLYLKNDSEPNQIEKPVIAILPGSREMEITKILPVMLEVVDAFPEYQFVVAAINSIEESFYKKIIGEKNCILLFNKTYSLLANSRAALVASGTATLETAIFSVPQIVCYRGNAISFWIAKRLVDVKYISLVNLILDRQLIKELIQADLTKENIIIELNRILLDEIKRTEIFSGYKELQEKLGGPSASLKTAQSILESMKQEG
ncbi:MAG: lipid-A-disaccharide synthase [Chitinophagales bacterium]|nr:lipid-A-disaccharide synthase [Chitinophagales bacterium]